MSMPSDRSPAPRDPRDHQSKRTFSELKPTKGRLRDVDNRDMGIRTYAIIAGCIGAILGTALAGFLYKKEMAPIPVIMLVPLVFAVAVGYSVIWITNSAGRVGSTLYSPSGKTTPPRKEYSQAEAMVVQGRYEDGITAFELAISEDAADPTPYLRIARVYRDNLARHEDAARWFRRALREAVVPRGVELLARKELVELYTHRLNQPERALPELARMADELAGTDEGAWAAGHYAEIKARMASSPERATEGDPPTTT